MVNGKIGYVDGTVYDKDGDLKVKGKKKVKTESGELVYEDVDEEEEDEVYKFEKVEI
jgi:hypothetical protein